MSSLNNSLEDHLSTRKLYKVKRVGAQSLPPRLIEFIQRLHFVKIDHAAECRDHILYISIRLITAPSGRESRERSFPIPPRKTRPSEASRNRGKVIPLSLLFRLGQTGSFIIGLSRVRSQ